VLLVTVTILPGGIGLFGPVYLAGAVALGAVFCALAWRLWREPGSRRAGVLFHYSLLYLALLFVAVAIDAVVG
jgi:protoheme IX farnesyltransferase